MTTQVDQQAQLVQSPELAADLKQLNEDYTYRINSLIERDRDELLNGVSREYERDYARLMRVHQRRHTA